MTVKYAVDCSSWTGTMTVAQAQAIKDMGFAKAVVNLYGRETCQSQVDAFRAVGMEVDGYIYYYFSQDAVERTNRLLANLEGRPINFLWLDWEDDETQLTVPDTINYIQRAQDACRGVVFTGHYTRREWWVRRTGDSQVFAGQWLWDATNDRTPDMSWDPYGGFRHYMEQYAFDVELVSGLGPFDLNVYEEAAVPGVPGPPAPHMTTVIIPAGATFDAGTTVSWAALP